MTTQVTQPTEAPEDDNPVVAEMERLNAAGDDAEMLAEIAKLNAAESEDGEGAETPVQAAPTVPATPTAPAPAAQPTAQAPVAPVAPVAPAAPDLAAQQETERLRQQVAEYQRKVQEQEDEHALQTNVQQYKSYLENTLGLEANQAAAIAAQRGEDLKRQYELQRQGERQVAEAQAKVTVASRMAEQYKVPIQALLAYNSPQAMEQAAKGMQAQSTQAAEMKRMQDEINALKKQTIPAQNFDNNRAAPIAGTDDNSLVDRYNSGERTPEVVAAMKRLTGI